MAAAAAEKEVMKSVMDNYMLQEMVMVMEELVKDYYM